MLLQISQNIYEYNNDSFKDLLTKFNNEEILYDDIGNPTNIGSKNLTWINGRQLQSYSDSINNITYKYNKDGIRISKTVNNVKTMYELEGNDIVFEKTNNNVIYYIRSASELIGLKYNDNISYYIKNNQNDIIGITDSNYNIIANYKYDCFGNIVSITDDEGSIITNNNHIAIINPFRYRCYYYDRETNLYYLNSRYYNPEWGRFINADGIINGNTDIIGHNLYAYCSNNPVGNMDSEGLGIISCIVAAVVGGVVGVVNKFLSNAYSSALSGKKVNASARDYVMAGVSSAVGGAISTVNPILGSASSSALSTTYESAKTQGETGKKQSLINDAINFTMDFVISSAFVLKSPKITTGKNNYSSVYKSGLTKLRNDTASRMSYRVVAKGIMSEVASSSISTIYDGGRNYIDDKLGWYYNVNNPSKKMYVCYAWD